MLAGPLRGRGLGIAPACLDWLPSRPSATQALEGLGGMGLIYLERDPAESQARVILTPDSASIKLVTKEVGLGVFICEMKANLQLWFCDLLFC